MTPTMVISEQDYQLLEKAEKSLESLQHKLEKIIADRDEYKSAYEKSVDLALKKSVIFENLKSQNETLRIMLSQACDEMEGIFNTTGRLASPEIATQYIVWAQYLKHNFGRDDAGCIGEVQNWIDGI